MNSNCGKAMVGLKYSNMLNIAGNNLLSLHARAPQSLTWWTHQRVPWSCHHLCGLCCSWEGHQHLDLAQTYLDSMGQDQPRDLALYNLDRSPAPDEVTSSSTQFFSDWPQHWENALDGSVQDQPGGHLPHTFRGRAKCTQPMKASLASPVSKPSRQGEVQLRSDLVSTQVQLWFKQLWRLQSYKHAAAANKQTLDAEVYRLSLWAAIKKGRGFDGFFNEVWLRRRLRSPSAPEIFHWHLLMAPLQSKSFWISSRTLKPLSSGIVDNVESCCNWSTTKAATDFFMSCVCPSVTNWTFFGTTKTTRSWQ